MEKAGAKEKVTGKVTFECDGRIESQYPNRGSWGFFAGDGKDSFLVEREGYFEVTNQTTTDVADFLAAKEAIIWATSEFSNREIEILTKSTVVANWLRDKSSTRYGEIHRELYEQKALTDKFTIRVIPEEFNRAVNLARRRDLLVAKNKPSEL